MHVSRNEGPDATELYAVDDNHQYRLPRLPERAPSGPALLALAHRELHRYPRFGDAERRFVQGGDPRLRQVLGQLSPGELEATLHEHYGQRGLGARIERATDGILRAMMADVALPRLARLAARTTDAESLARIDARFAALSRHDVTPGALPELADEARAKAGLGWAGPARGASTSAELISDAPVPLHYLQQVGLEAERGYAHMALGLADGPAGFAWAGHAFIGEHAALPCVVGERAAELMSWAKTGVKLTLAFDLAKKLHSLNPVASFVGKEAADRFVDGVARHDLEKAVRSDPAAIDHDAGLRPTRPLTLGKLDAEWSDLCKPLRAQLR